MRERILKFANTLPIANIPVGTLINNIELYPGKGSQLVRAAGNAAQLMAKEGKYLEAYFEELEYKFINLFYQNTLFSYMRGKQRKKLSFIRNMGKEMKQYFPDFQNNKYYLQKVDEEERFLMSLQQKSTAFFVAYYKLLWTYRRLRYGMK